MIKSTLTLTELYFGTISYIFFYKGSNIFLIKLVILNTNKYIFYVFLTLSPGKISNFTKLFNMSELSSCTVKNQLKGLESCYSNLFRRFISRFFPTWTVNVFLTDLKKIASLIWSFVSWNSLLKIFINAC